MITRVVVPWAEAVPLVKQAMGFVDDDVVVAPMAHPSRPGYLALEARVEVVDVGPDGKPATAEVTLTFGKPAL